MKGVCLADVVSEWLVAKPSVDWWEDSYVWSWDLWAYRLFELQIKPSREEGWFVYSLLFKGGQLVDYDSTNDFIRRSKIKAYNDEVPLWDYLMEYEQRRFLSDLQLVANVGRLCGTFSVSTTANMRRRLGKVEERLMGGKNEKNSK